MYYTVMYSINLYSTDMAGLSNKTRRKNEKLTTGSNHRSAGRQSSYGA